MNTRCGVHRVASQHRLDTNQRFAPDGTPANLNFARFTALSRIERIAVLHTGWILRAYLDSTAAGLAGGGVFLPEKKSLMFEAGNVGEKRHHSEGASRLEPFENDAVDGFLRRTDSMSARVMWPPS